MAVWLEVSYSDEYFRDTGEAYGNSNAVRESAAPQVKILQDAHLGKRQKKAGSSRRYRIACAAKRR